MQVRPKDEWKWRKIRRLVCEVAKNWRFIHLWHSTRRVCCVVGFLIDCRPCGKVMASANVSTEVAVHIATQLADAGKHPSTPLPFIAYVYYWRTISLSLYLLTSTINRGNCPFSVLGGPKSLAKQCGRQARIECGYHCWYLKQTQIMASLEENTILASFCAHSGQ